MPEAIRKLTPPRHDQLMDELKIVQAIQKVEEISPVVLQVYINRICCGTPTSGEVEYARRQLARNKTL